MKIVFFFEYGNIDEIGFGHLYRSKVLAKELEKRGHVVEFSSDPSGADVFVVDHMMSQKDLLQKANGLGVRTILIDGSEDDVAFADVAISAFVNWRAKHKGFDYLVFPKMTEPCYYDPDKPKNNIFVGMGGFDKNNFATMAVRAAHDLEIDVIVAKSNNHSDFENRYANVIVSQEEDYYKDMSQSFMAITNGGLTMFQALYFGMPCIPLAQYEHQKKNIAMVEHFCVPCHPDVATIRDRIQLIRNDSQLRRDLNHMACRQIDGEGDKRVCDIIEETR